jgi:signal peptidase I
MQFLSQKSSFEKLVKDHGRKILNVLVLLVVIVIGCLGSWFVLKTILGTEYPIVPVSSSNMCVFQFDCDGLIHSFEPTLHVGDLIIIQGVNCSAVRAAYPNSDILVFQSPKSDSYQNDGLIITRVVAKEERNGTIYFRTKSDGAGVHAWPEIPGIPECDRWYDYRENYTWNGMISEKLLVGKVDFRIPWIGYVALFVQNPSGILVLVLIIVIIILIVEFAVPKFTRKRAETKTKKSVEDALET